MSEENNPNASAQDELSKEFDEIIASTDQDLAVKQDDTEGVAIEVKRDHDDVPEVLQTPEDVEPSTISEPAMLSVQSEPEVVAPVVEATSPVAPLPHTRSSGATMVLQWLSYAFWGWFGVSLSWLTGVVAAYLVVGDSSDVTVAIAYPLASVIVLFILSIATDAWYSRREPAHKAGGANAIMLVHVVLFVLIAVGAAVTAVFALISALLTTDPNSGTDGQVIALWTSLSTVIVFSLIAVRALFGGKRKALRIAYWIAMSLIALGLIVTSIVGPIAGAQTTKDDRIIENGLPELSQAIGDYVNENSKLPADLGVIQKTSGRASIDTLVTRSLVRYTPNVKASTEAPEDMYSYGTTYYYRLCVTYKNAKKTSGTYYGASSVTRGEYSSYLSINAHDKGEVCYNLKAIDSSDTVYSIGGDASKSGSSSSKD